MMITASIKNKGQEQEIDVSTEGRNKKLSIPAKHEGNGSSVNGGELLCLALAACFCNDIYREAAKRNMNIESVEVTVNSKFGGEGEPASSISYNAEIFAPDHTAEQISELLNYVDKIAEVHNTVRRGTVIRLLRGEQTFAN